jgi:hypothetical protein
MTIVNYWGSFGTGDLSRATILAVKERVASWAKLNSLVQ